MSRADDLKRKRDELLRQTADAGRAMDAYVDKHYTGKRLDAYRDDPTFKQLEDRNWKLCCAAEEVDEQYRKATGSDEIFTDAPEFPTYTSPTWNVTGATAPPTSPQTPQSTEKEKRIAAENTWPSRFDIAPRSRYDRDDYDEWRRRMYLGEQERLRQRERNHARWHELSPNCEPGSCPYRERY